MGLAQVRRGRALTATCELVSFCSGKVMLLQGRDTLAYPVVLGRRTSPASNVELIVSHAVQWAGGMDKTPEPSGFFQWRA